MGKKLLSLLLAVVLIAMVLPMTAMAADAQLNQPTSFSMGVKADANTKDRDYTVRLTCTSGPAAVSVTHPKGTTSLNPNSSSNSNKRVDIDSFTQPKNQAVDKSYNFSATFTQAGTYVFTLQLRNGSSNVGTASSFSVTVVKCQHTKPLTEKSYKLYACSTSAEGKYWECECGACFTKDDPASPAFDTKVLNNIPKHNYTTAQIPATKSTCTEAGKKAHYECLECKKWFDSKGGTAYDADSTHFNQTLADHDLEQKTYKQYSCEATASGKYWQCKNCPACFDNKDGKGTVYPAEHFVTKDHNIDNNKVNGTASCKQDGYLEHRVCKTTGCNAWFALDDDTAKTKEDFFRTKSEMDHVFGDQWFGGEEATCDKPGTKKYHKCTVCGGSFDEEGNLLVNDEDFVTPKLSHKTTTVREPATCLQPGILECQFCSECKRYSKDGENWYEKDSPEYEENIVEQRLKHQVEPVKATPPTCVEDGVLAHYECVREGCGLWFFTEDATELFTPNHPAFTDPALGHKKGTPHEKVPATCSATGVKAYWECTRCDAKLKADGTAFTDKNIVIGIDEKNHTPVFVKGTAPTCEEDGVKDHYECSGEGCIWWFVTEDGEPMPDYHNVFVDPATGHKKGEHHDAVPGTCTEPGTKQYWECENCDAMLNASGKRIKVMETPIDPDNHDWVKGTEEAGGVEYEVCSRCGKLRLADGSIVEGIPSMHTLDFHQGYPATCTEAGEYDYWFCTDKDCGLMFKDLNATEILKDAVIPAKGHTPVKVTHVQNCWMCTECGLYFSDEACKTPMDQPADVAKHALVNYAKQAPNCQTGDGHEQYWLCVACGDLYADKDGVAMTSLNKVQIPYRANNPEHHHVVEVKATTENIAYWECQDCGMCFDGNKEGAKVLDPSEVGKTENVGDHSLKFQPQVPATCTTDGVKAHWLCLSSHNCSKYYADSLAKTPMTKAELVIPAAHTYIHFKGTAADMDNEGRKGYDYCTVCHLVRLDGSESWITMEEAMKNWGIDKAPDRSDAVMVPEEAPTCIKTGVKKHWECKDLRNDNKTLYFLDEALTQQVSEADLVIPMVNHTLYPVAETGTAKKYWKCLVCHGCFETDDPTPGKPGGEESDFEKPPVVTEPAPEPTDPPEGVIKDGLDLSGMTVTTGGGKYNAP